jgi:hypothetical protein
MAGINGEGKRMAIGKNGQGQHQTDCEMINEMRLTCKVIQGQKTISTTKINIDIPYAMWAANNKNWYIKHINPAFWNRIHH